MALDPILQRLLTKAYLNGFGNIHYFTPEQVRSYLRHPKLKVEQANFQDFKTSTGLRLRSYTPKLAPSQQRYPVVIYLSASAFVIDRMDTSNDYCSLLANQLNMKVIHVAHRLAPEHQFPQHHIDCIASIKWIAEQAELLEIDPNRIALWGESSGGNIAASCAHMLRDEGCDLVKHLTLFYPMVDLVTPFPSKTLYGKGYMFDLSFMEWIAARVLPPEQDRADPYVSPLLATNFENLPATTMITAEYDLLRDEGAAYAEKLMAARVPTEFKQFDGMIHGFMRFYQKVPTANEALAFASNALQNHFQIKDKPPALTA